MLKFTYWEDITSTQIQIKKMFHLLSISLSSRGCGKKIKSFRVLPWYAKSCFHMLSPAVMIFSRFGDLEEKSSLYALFIHLLPQRQSLNRSNKILLFRPFREVGRNFLLGVVFTQFWLPPLLVILVLKNQVSYLFVATICLNFWL